MTSNNSSYKDLQDLRVLVTGGAGFIGSHLVERLLDIGASVICYDNFDDFYLGKEENIKHLLHNKNFQLIRNDILNVHTLSEIVRKVDVIFHVAGQTGIRYCNENPEKANRVNVDGTLNVLLAAKQYGIKKVVYASSSSVFGDPVYLPMDEKHPTIPNSPYGVSKLAGENYCLAFNRVYGLNASCLRYFSVYGPRGRPDQVIYAFTQQIAGGKPPIIYGDGSQTRDFTFVSDIVDATIRAMERDEANGQVFNIGLGEKISIKELVQKVTKGLGREDVRPIYKEKSKGDFAETKADNAKARKLLGWTPKVKIDDGLVSFLKWYRSQKLLAMQNI